MFGTYNRLGVHVSASNLTLLKAARIKLKKGAYLSDPIGCKRFYRLMIEQHTKARALFINCRF